MIQVDLAIKPFNMRTHQMQQVESTRVTEVQRLDRVSMKVPYIVMQIENNVRVLQSFPCTHTFIQCVKCDVCYNGNI